MIVIKTDSFVYISSYYFLTRKVASKRNEGDKKSGKCLVLNENFLYVGGTFSIRGVGAIPNKK